MSRYDQEVQRLVAILTEQNYSQIAVDFGYPFQMAVKKEWNISACRDNNVRVVIARESSWKKVYTAALEYLAL